MCCFKIRFIVALATFTVGIAITTVWISFRHEANKEIKTISEVQPVSKIHLPTKNPSLATPSLSEIDLAKIEHIMPKGRVQDKDYNNLPTVDHLIAHGKDSIPFLISKLDDETPLENRSIPYWYEQTVGDVAFIILMDFFLDARWEKSTVAGMEWNQFLGRGNDRNSTAESLLRRYISKYGRKQIKERWQKVWDTHKDNIFWDEGERCFKVADKVA